MQGPRTKKVAVRGHDLKLDEVTGHRKVEIPGPGGPDDGGLPLVSPPFNTRVFGFGVADGPKLEVGAVQHKSLGVERFVPLTQAARDNIEEEAAEHRREELGLDAEEV